MESAVPVAGTAITEPPEGGVFSASVMNAAASPLESSTASLNLYRYPVSSTLGESTRNAPVMDDEEMKFPDRRSTVSVEPPASGTRVADQSNASESADASRRQ